MSAGLVASDGHRRNKGPRSKEHTGRMHATVVREGVIGHQEASGNASPHADGEERGKEKPCSPIATETAGTPWSPGHVLSEWWGPQDAPGRTRLTSSCPARNRHACFQDPFSPSSLRQQTCQRCISSLHTLSKEDMVLLSCLFVCLIFQSALFTLV